MNWKKKSISFTTKLLLPHVSFASLDFQLLFLPCDWSGFSHSSSFFFFSYGLSGVEKEKDECENET